MEGIETVEAAARRLRAAAEARPMKLPVNRRVDESHHAVTADGLSVWFTIQVSPHARIQEAVFERTDRMPSDDEVHSWLDLLIVGAQPSEAPTFSITDSRPTTSASSSATALSKARSRTRSCLRRRRIRLQR